MRQRTDLAGKLAQLVVVVGSNVAVPRPIDVMRLPINTSMATQHDLQCAPRLDNGLDDFTFAVCTIAHERNDHPM